MTDPTQEEADKFLKRVMEDLGHDLDNFGETRYLAAVKDLQSDNYILVMIVPPSALSDGVGPDLHRTPDDHRFLAAISQNVFFDKAEKIEEEFPDANEEEKNELMAEFIAEFMPALFERAVEMPALDV